MQMSQNRAPEARLTHYETVKCEREYVNPKERRTVFPKSVIPLLFSIRDCECEKEVKLLLMVDSKY